MTEIYDNHYTWLEDNLDDFAENIKVRSPWGICGLIGAHGDKCYGYKSRWEEAGIVFPHGVAIYLLGHVNPYASEVRDTDDGWVDICEWVIYNYSNGHKFKDKLPPCEYETMVERVARLEKEA